MLTEFQFTNMMLEVEEATNRKIKAIEDLKEIHARYGLTPSGYKAKKTTLINNDPSIEKYILNKLRKNEEKTNGK